MKKQVVRLVVMLAASVGLVALVADAAYARIILNHSEPVR
jgi:ATP-dependent protease ClpP protease subunit